MFIQQNLVNHGKLYISKNMIIMNQLVREKNKLKVGMEVMLLKNS